jgi:predicted anti-sigma-YlaC factor YlaD
MKCNEFHNQLASIREKGQLTREMMQHMETCSSCSEMYARTQSLFDVIAEEKAEKVSPFINTRILAQIEKQEKRVWLARPAIVSLMSVFIMVLGFFTAGIFTNQNQMASDSTEIIASEYYFSDNPGSQLEEIWLNSYVYE